MAKSHPKSNSGKPVKEVAPDHELLRESWREIIAVMRSCVRPYPTLTPAPAKPAVKAPVVFVEIVSTYDDPDAIVTIKQAAEVFEDDAPEQAQIAVVEEVPAPAPISPVAPDGVAPAVNVEQPAPVPNVITLLQVVDTLPKDDLLLVQSKINRKAGNQESKLVERRMAGDAEHGDGGKYVEVYYVPRKLASGVEVRYQYQRYVWFTKTSGGKRIKHTEHIKGSGKKAA